MGETFLDPVSIRFSQDTISEHFKDRAELVLCRVNVLLCSYACFPVPYFAVFLVFWCYLHTLHSGVWT